MDRFCVPSFFLVVVWLPTHLFSSLIVIRMPEVISRKEMVQKQKRQVAIAKRIRRDREKK